MKYKYNLENLSALDFNRSCAPLVDDLCMPFFENFGITHFGCIRILDNGKILRIANNESWSKAYFESEFYNDQDMYSMKHVPLNERRLTLLSGFPDSKHGKMLFSKFNIWNFLLIYERFLNYGDFWFMGTTRNNTNIPEFYINNLDLIQHFILYFKSKTPQLFDISDASKLISSKNNHLGKENAAEDNINNFINEISFKKHYLDGHRSGTSLSKREAECLFYLSQGLTMREISEALHLSPRTVETYLNNIKIKTQCNTKGELISLFLQNGK